MKSDEIVIPTKSDSWCYVPRWNHSSIFYYLGKVILWVLLCVTFSFSGVSHGISLDKKEIPSSASSSAEIPDYFEFDSSVPPLPPALGGLPPGSGKIEVIEFFYYGCPHCQNIEPGLADWVQSHSAEINFQYVPAVIPRWWLMGQLFFTLKEMGLIPRLHSAVYQALVTDKRDLTNVKTMLEWLGEQQINAEDFLRHWESSRVKDQMRFAQRVGQEYQLRTTPTLVVGGRYRWTLTDSIPKDQLSLHLDILLRKAQSLTPSSEK